MAQQAEMSDMALRLRDENLSLKRKSNELEERLKMMDMRTRMLTNSLRKAAGPGGIAAAMQDVNVQELEMELESLRRQNKLLNDRLRQQDTLATTRAKQQGRVAPYGRVVPPTSSKIAVGIPRKDRERSTSATRTGADSYSQRGNPSLLDSSFRSSATDFTTRGVSPPYVPSRDYDPKRTFTPRAADVSGAVAEVTSPTPSASTAALGDPIIRSRLLNAETDAANLRRENEELKLKLSRLAGDLQATMMRSSPEKKDSSTQSLTETTAGGTGSLGALVGTGTTGDQVMVSRSQLLDVERALKDKAAQVLLLKARLEHLESRSGSERSLYDRSLRAMEEQAQQIATLRNSLTAANSENETLRAKLEATGEASAALLRSQEECRRLEAQLTELASSPFLLQTQQGAQAKKRVEELEKAFALSSEKVEFLSKTLRARNADLEALKKDTAEAQKRADNSKMEAQQHKFEAEDARRTVTLLRERLALFSGVLGGPMGMEDAVGGIPGSPGVPGRVSDSKEGGKGVSSPARSLTSVQNVASIVPVESLEQALAMVRHAQDGESALTSTSITSGDAARLFEENHALRKQVDSLNKALAASQSENARLDTMLRTQAAVSDGLRLELQEYKKSGAVASIGDSRTPLQETQALAMSRLERIHTLEAQLVAVTSKLIDTRAKAKQLTETMERRVHAAADAAVAAATRVAESYRTSGGGPEALEESLQTLASVIEDEFDGALRPRKRRGQQLPGVAEEVYDDDAGSLISALTEDTRYLAELANYPLEEIRRAVETATNLAVHAAGGTAYGDRAIPLESDIGGGLDGFDRTSAGGQTQLQRTGIGKGDGREELPVLTSPSDSFSNSILDLNLDPGQCGLEVYVISANLNPNTLHSILHVPGSTATTTPVTYVSLDFMDFEQENSNYASTYLPVYNFASLYVFDANFAFVRNVASGVSLTANVHLSRGNTFGLLGKASIPLHRLLSPATKIHYDSLPIVSPVSGVVLGSMKVEIQVSFALQALWQSFLSKHPLEGKELAKKVLTIREDEEKDLLSYDEAVKENPALLGHSLKPPIRDNAKSTSSAAATAAVSALTVPDQSGASVDFEATQKSETAAANTHSGTTGGSSGEGLAQLHRATDAPVEVLYEQNNLSFCIHHATSFPPSFVNAQKSLFIKYSLSLPAGSLPHEMASHAPPHSHTPSILSGSTHAVPCKEVTVFGVKKQHTLLVTPQLLAAFGDAQCQTLTSIAARPLRLELYQNTSGSAQKLATCHVNIFPLLYKQSFEADFRFVSETAALGSTASALGSTAIATVRLSFQWDKGLSSSLHPDPSVLPEPFFMLCMDYLSDSLVNAHAINLRRLYTLLAVDSEAWGILRVAWEALSAFLFTASPATTAQARLQWTARHREMLESLGARLSGEGLTADIVHKTLQKLVQISATQANANSAHKSDVDSSKERVVQTLSAANVSILFNAVKVAAANLYLLCTQRAKIDQSMVHGNSPTITDLTSLFFPPSAIVIAVIEKLRRHLHPSKVEVTSTFSALATFTQRLLGTAKESNAITGISTATDEVKARLQDLHIRIPAFPTASSHFSSSASAPSLPHQLPALSSTHTPTATAKSHSGSGTTQAIAPYYGATSFAVQSPVNQPSLSQKVRMEKGLQSQPAAHSSSPLTHLVPGPSEPSTRTPGTYEIQPDVPIWAQATIPPSDMAIMLYSPSPAVVETIGSAAATPSGTFTNTLSNTATPGILPPKSRSSSVTATTPAAAGSAPLPTFPMEIPTTPAEYDAMVATITRDGSRASTPAASPLVAFGASTGASLGVATTGGILGTPATPLRVEAVDLTDLFSMTLHTDKEKAKMALSGGLSTPDTSRKLFHSAVEPAKTAAEDDGEISDLSIEM